MQKYVEPLKSLEDLQAWFGAVITQAIDEDSRISPIAPSGESIELEAKKFIRPSKTLSPASRIQIYNQQYWWRLLNIMHENFPLATSLFGYFDFNQTIATPYLLKYPPAHWSLNTLGDTLPAWVLENYHEDDKNLVLDSVNVDLAYNLCFTAGELKKIEIHTEEEGLAVLKKKVATQSYLFLIEMSYDLIPFRANVLKQTPDYFEDHDFPPLKKRKTHIGIYRDASLNITWKEISPEEHDVLNRFKEGRTVEEFCTWLEGQPQLARVAEKHLIHWFREWIALGWIGLAEN